MDGELKKGLELMEPTRFEQFAFSLVHVKHPDAERLANPDGGADSLVVRSIRRPLVFQVKHFPKRIRWEQCESSLNAAAGWDPEEVTFIFPRDLSGPERKTFSRRLAHRHPGIRVRWWGLGKIEELLAERPTIRTRYFGEDPSDLFSKLDRAIAAGGSLEDTESLVKRLRAAGAYADGRDPDFSYSMTVGASGMASPTSWDVLPHVFVQVDDGEHAVQFGAWPRPEAEIPISRWGFTTDEDGQRAREKARRELAAGGEVELTAGVWLQMQAPELVRDLTGPKVEAERIYIGASRPITIDIIADPDGERKTRTAELRWIPPLEGDGLEFTTAPDDGLGLTLRLEPVGDFGSLHVRFTWRLKEGDAASQREIGELTLAIAEKGLLLRAPGFLPEGLRERLPRPEAAELAARTRGLLAFLDDVILIERTAGVPLPLPAKLSEKDFADVYAVADVIKSGRGTATFQTGDHVVPAGQISGIAAAVSGQRIHRPVSYVVLGRAVIVGTGEYELPKLKVVEVRPLGRTPDAPAHVYLAADGDDQMTFTLAASGANGSSM